MKFVNAGADSVGRGTGKLPGSVSYFRGSDPSKWTRGIPTFQKVRFPDVYPGIDVVYYGNQGQVEFDLVAAPGSDPGAILLDFEGAEDLRTDSQGNLLATVKGRELRIRSPLVYQDVAGVRKTVPGGFRLQSSHSVGFQLADYDKRQVLVIDPTIVYSTVVGGSGSDYGASVAVDAVGNIYLTGTTFSIDFPLTAGALKTGASTNTRECFITKLNATGTAIIYSAYVGGDGDEVPSNIAVDGVGNVFVGGYTSSSNFPQVNALFSQFGGGNQGFVLKLNSSGSTLLYATYLGGSGLNSSYVFGLAADVSGNAYVTGSTELANFPTTPGAYSGPLPTASGVDFPLAVAFLCKFSPAGALIYSSLIGAGEGFSVSVDSAGAAYVTGYTNTSTFPAVGTLNGSMDAFVLKMNPSGTALAYSTFLGGSSQDIGESIAVDGAGQAYVAGYTRSNDFPVTPGSAQTLAGGGADSFVAKFSATGSSLLYATYLGGRNDEVPSSIAVDGAGNAVVAGQTLSANFPTASAIQTAIAGNLASLSSYNPALQLWQPADTGFPGMSQSVSLNPVTGSSVISTDAGTYRSLASGGVWTPVSTKTLYYLNRALSQPSTLFGLTSDSVYSSVDDGQTWTGPVAIPNLWPVGVTVDIFVSSTIYVYGMNGTGENLARSTDSSQSFSFLVTPYPLSTLVIAPGTPNVLLTIQNGQLSRSVDSAVTWSTAAGISGNGLAQDPNALGTIYAFGSGAFLSKSTNAGATWTQMQTPALITALAVAQGNSAKLYAAVAQGVILSSDGGSSWSSAAPGLGGAPVNSIVANATTALVLQSISPTGFVTKINSSGTGFVYSTFLGGTGYDGAASVAILGSDAIVAGYTSSTDFPLAAGTVGQAVNGMDAFVTRFSDTTASCSYHLHPGSISFDITGGTASVGVISPTACNWNATSGSSWLSINANNSSGTAPLNISAAINTGSARTGTVTVGGQFVAVQQAGIACTYLLSASSINIAPLGGTGSVSVTTGSGCGWMTVNSNPQVGVTAGLIGSGNGVVTFSVLATSGAATVTYSLTIAGIAYSIVQIPTHTNQNNTNLGVYRNGSWFVDYAGKNGFDPATYRAYAFGVPSDIPVIGDWNGDGRPKLGVYRNGSWFVDYAGKNGFDPATYRAYAFGVPGDIPVIGDWNGDGRPKLGVYRNGLWFVDYAGKNGFDPATYRVYAFGVPGDIPVIGDWNGDGRSKLGVYRNGLWFVDYAGKNGFDPATYRVYAFGVPGDIPVIGDWNGDGRSKLGVYRNGLWFVDYAGKNGFDPATYRVYAFGVPGDIPVMGRWNLNQQITAIANFSPLNVQANEVLNVGQIYESFMVRYLADRQRASQQATKHLKSQSEIQQEVRRMQTNMPTIRDPFHDAGQAR